MLFLIGRDVEPQILRPNTKKCMPMSKVENAAKVLSCLLKFVRVILWAPKQWGLLC
jgi:hypothetical protein